MIGIKEDGVAVKEQEGKVMMDLLVPEFLIEMGRVMTGVVASGKYEANNWRWGQGLPWSMYVAAAYRHLTAFHAGSPVDHESNLHHMAHLACNAMILHYYSVNKHKYSRDDLYGMDDSLNPSSIEIVEIDIPDEDNTKGASLTNIMHPFNDSKE